MDSATCLDTDQARRNPGEKLQIFASSKLAFNDDIPDTIDAVHLKNVLRQIKPDRSNRFHGQLSQCERFKTTTLCHKTQGVGPSTTSPLLIGICSHVGVRRWRTPLKSARYLPVRLIFGRRGDILNISVVSQCSIRLLANRYPQVCILRCRIDWFDGWTRFSQPHRVKPCGSPVNALDLKH